MILGDVLGCTGDYGRLGLLMVTEKNRNERKIRGMVTEGGEVR